MEYILHEDENGKTVIHNEKDFVRILQYDNEGLTGEVILYHQEIKRLNEFIIKDN